MKIIKKFIPFLIFLSMIGIGIKMFVEVNKSDITSNNSFFYISLIIIGGIGLICSFFTIAIFSIKTKILNRNPLKTIEEKIKNISQKLKSKYENQEVFFGEKQDNVKLKHKKRVCSYCKLKYDEALDRCPSCGAPPSSEN